MDNPFLGWPDLVVLGAILTLDVRSRGGMEPGRDSPRLAG